MFAGVYTAIVTPFAQDGSVDYGRLRELVEFQIAGGVTGLVPVGTTGESPTLDYDEHNRVIAETIAAARGRVQIVAGTGANSTKEALNSPSTRWTRAPMPRCRSRPTTTSRTPSA